MDVPLLAFDPDPESFLVPGPPQLVEPMPDRAVLCFFPEVLDWWQQLGKLRPIGGFSRELGGRAIYVYENPDEGNGEFVAVFHPGVGAPLAVHCLEQAIAAGASRFAVCGGAGSLSPGFAKDAVLVIDEAVRDEGTSYHYAPATRTIRFDRHAVATALRVLEEAGVPSSQGKSWTTDASYRETRQRIAERVAEGCVAVEMEASALAAVASFRGVTLSQFVYGGDDLTGDTWDARGWAGSPARDRLVQLAIRVVQAL